MTAMRSALRSQLDEQGYVVVRDVIPQENLDAVIADIWRHTGASPSDRESWYQPDRISGNGMVEMYHYQSMWNNRQHPHLYQTFVDVLGTERLWVTLDRTNLKPPADARHPRYDHKGFIHWDADTSTYPNVAFGVQGVLALTDTDESMGGFQCVPELYRDLGEWIARQPADRDPSRPDLTGYTITPVPLRAGDMVIWTDCSRMATGTICQIGHAWPNISMGLANEEDAAARQARITSWQKRLPPEGSAFPGDPRKIEEQLPEPPDLTPLGRKLLGLDSWG